MRGGKVLKRKDISSSRIMVMEDGREFYPAKYRMDDFKKEHPTGRFSTEAIEFKANSMAVFKAYVYPDSDPDSRPLSEAYCMRWYDMNTVNFVETAETGAISRALANAGYNLCSYELNEGIDPLSRMIDLDGNPYLNVMWRLAWIRRDIPSIYIKKELLSLSNNTALVKVELFDNGKLLATAHASKTYCHNENGGEYFVDWAETAATGRAISQLGYDLPVDSSSIYDEPIISDAPKFVNTNPDLEQLMEAYDNTPQNLPAEKPEEKETFDFEQKSDVQVISFEINEGTDPNELSLDNAFHLKPNFGKYANQELRDIAEAGDLNWLLKMSTLMKETYPLLASGADMVYRYYK